MKKAILMSFAAVFLLFAATSVGASLLGSPATNYVYIGSPDTEDFFEPDQWTPGPAASCGGIVDIPCQLSADDEGHLEQILLDMDDDVDALIALAGKRSN